MRPKFGEYLLLACVFLVPLSQAQTTCNDEQDCDNGGTCIIEDGQKSCVCYDEYIGERCEHINPCSSSKCFNGGTCEPTLSVDSQPSFICYCVLGYTTSTCASRITQHACFPQNPCRNDGRCELVDTLDNYRCQCSTGYRGVNCTEVDYCTNHQCSNGATCVSGTSDYTCECTSGYRGSLCNDDINECVETPSICLHSSTCHNLEGSFFCNCSSGYVGLNCETLYVPCESSPCQNGGSCRVADMNREYCLCASGFTGKYCDINLDDCEGHNCTNRGVCIDGIDSYTCQCPDEYTGNFCQIDVDECRNPSHCDNGATCKNTDGGFECICSLGYSGIKCGSNIDDCAESTCSHGGTCIDGIAAFQCICPPTYEGHYCQYQSACVSSPCHASATCETDPLSQNAKCLCPEGRDGSDCSVDVDECVFDPCVFGQCINTPGSYYCECNQGYTGLFCDEDVDECLSNPCLNGGTCLNLEREYLCLCIDGYSGEMCEEDINECVGNPCQNGGVCADRVNDYSCTCQNGWTGHDCDEDIDECASNPCGGGNTCLNDENQFRCLCAAGVSGYNCEIALDPCEDRPCHHGSCDPTGNSFVCICDPGYTGSECQTDIDECESSPCQNLGECIDRENRFECRCQEGTSGQLCQYNNNECASNPCANGATCQDGINEYTCQCPPGYEGTLCQVDVNECASAPCYNGGTCTDGVDQFRCDCLPGYSGDFCLSDVNECTSSPCLNGGTCTNLESSFNCTCPRGYTGTHCHIDINECSSNPCRHGGVCHETVDFYQCACQPGYNGTNCEYNIDDCAANPCHHGGTCLDRVNAFSCHCLPPYTGPTCQQELVPCASHACQNGATCVPTASYTSYTCTCQRGYQGNSCQLDYDECGMNPCKNGGTCNNTYGGFQCLCAPGFEGDKCEFNIDDCAQDPCRNGGTCTDRPNGYVCTCPSGFTGPDCESQIDECASSPCHGSATCTDYVNSFTCTCPVGFSGVYCQNNDDDCSVSSCLSGGTCNDGINFYTCTCQPAYTGPNCELEVNECESSPCRNGGTCRDQLASFKCVCPLGYTGVTCEDEVMWCQSEDTDPCNTEHGRCVQNGHMYRCECEDGWLGQHCDVPQMTCVQVAAQRGIIVDAVCNHQGMCYDHNDSVHACSCLPGYHGYYCQFNTDECASQPCVNGGTCSDGVNSFSCHCASGFEGTTCEMNIDDCASNPCENGGNCFDRTNSYSCSCPTGTSGPNCEHNSNDCELNSCWNGGTCRDLVGRFTCDCPPGFVGDRCEGDVDECQSNPCSNQGSSKCLQGRNSYECVCSPGFTGPDCSEHVGLCSPSPCINDGTCIVSEEGYFCICQKSYHGDNCEIPDSCPSTPCKNGGFCMDGVCRCPSGYSGAHCMEQLTASTPKTINNPPVVPKCSDECSKRRLGDGCMLSCNVSACDWDHLNCVNHDNPEVYCPANACSELSNSGSCSQCSQEACAANSQNCPGDVHCKNDSYCIDRYNNGFCEEICNNPDCRYDGTDCKPPEFVGVIIIFVLMPPEELSKPEVSREFLRFISDLLRTVVTFVEEAGGDPKILVWNGKGGEAISFRRKRAASMGSAAYLKIDNSNCQQSGYNCYENPDNAVKLLDGLIEGGNLPDNKYGISDATLPSEPTSNPTYVIVACGVIFVLLFSVFLGSKRTIRTKCTYIPEDPNGPVRVPTKRPGPDGVDEYPPQIDGGLDWDSQSSSLDYCPSNRKRFKTQTGAAVAVKDGIQSRRWPTTTGPVPPGTPLTPPEMEYDQAMFLEYAVDPVPPSSAESSSEGEETIIHDIVKQCYRRLLTQEVAAHRIAKAMAHSGGDVNARDQHGSTPLHLASRFNLQKLCTSLLEASANVNAEDHTGRTPLHEAIANEAHQTFSTLISQRHTCVDKKTKKGLTPMIFAARLSDMPMLRALLDAKADTEIADDKGKTALHWAASVDNAEAVKLLLEKGANRDAKDNRDQTPLFLGAIEGSYTSVQYLLNHGANPSIHNDMQESPLEAAEQRHHSDIVALLNRMAAHPVMNGHMGQAYDSYRKKPKKPKAKVGGDHRNGEIAQKRKKKPPPKKNIASGGSVEAEPITTLSPPNSEPADGTPPPLYNQRMLGQDLGAPVYVTNGHVIPMDGHLMGAHGGYSSPCESPEGQIDMGHLRWSGRQHHHQPEPLGPGESRVLFRPDSNSLPQIIQQAPSTQSLVMSPSRVNCEYSLSPRTNRSPNRGQVPQPPSYQMRHQSPSSAMQPHTPTCEVPRLMMANSPGGGGETMNMYRGSPLEGQTQLQQQLQQFPTPPSNHSMSGGGPPSNTSMGPPSNHSMAGPPSNHSMGSMGNSPMQHLGGYLTPSPEASDHWSSSSPHKSPLDGWSGSEGISNSPGLGSECPVIDIASHQYHPYPLQQKSAFL